MFNDVINLVNSYMPQSTELSVEDKIEMLDKNDGVEINFEFAIYDKDLATKVQSDNFELTKL